jgi:hypothetical protein
MDLREWNERLAKHFGALARDRKDIPLFALEHGLTSAEVLGLSTALCSHITRYSPRSEHSLVWVVYAAEIGYGYAGHEYWQTFGEKTPGWTLNGTREWIRDAFVAFQREFAGAVPSGPWAEHRSIIAWPITHAILPRDLQRQLARILFDLRHSFSGELFDEPHRLGNFIAARSWNTSARFQILAQAEALVGQIAAALLLQGNEGSRVLLHPATLKRIRDDVERERSSREWLSGARCVAGERAQIRGLAVGKTRSTFQSHDEARAEVVRLGIEPRLVLRPLERSRWEVLLEIPDLSHLLLRFPQVRDVLTESRCSVAGAVGRPLARGRLLHGPQRVALNRLARPDDVLLNFERTDTQLEFLLRAECMFRPGATWLFKVASDALAYETRGLSVRADSKYIFASLHPIAHSHFTPSVELTCQGVQAVSVQLPKAITAEWGQVLRQLGLTQAKTIDVWPAGLAPCTWDGEGYGEWLTSETPILGIQADHAVDALSVAFPDDASQSTLLVRVEPGKPSFVELPRLRVGLHKVRICELGNEGIAIGARGHLDVYVRVREARTWSPGIPAPGLLEVELDPAAPSLEQLWEQNAKVEVRGAVQRQATFRIKMFVRAGESPIFERQLPLLDLPVSSRTWSRFFEEHVKKDRHAQRAFDEAQSCELEVSSDELGALTLLFEREFSPLRWSLTKDENSYLGRVHNDRSGDSPEIRHFSFESPAISKALIFDRDHTLRCFGGLYVATLNDSTAAIIVPPYVQRFQDHRFRPQFSRSERTAKNIAALLKLAALWGCARLPGDPIASWYRWIVMRKLSSHTLGLLCGSRWEKEESRPASDLVALSRLIPSRGADQNLGYYLHREVQSLASQAPSKIAKRLALFAEETGLLSPGATQRTVVNGIALVRRIRCTGPQDSVWLSEFALRIASDPASVDKWAGIHFEAGVERLLSVPALMRAARFLVVAVDQNRKASVTTGDQYVGWEWSV